MIHDININQYVEVVFIFICMKKKILVVEDQFIIAYDIKQVLEKQGYEVINNVSTMEDAIDVLDTLDIDLALIDIGLKGNRTGLDLGEYINQTHKIPFIYITSYHDNQTLSDIVKTHPAGYIVKPFKPLDITSAVEIAFMESALDQSSEALKKREEAFDQIPYRIKKVVQYIDDNIKERIEIDTLAAMTQYHKQHFIRTFQKAMNATPYQYILHKKIEKSCEMVITSDSPCSDIAYEFGFLSYANFNKAFKKIKGYTPEQYRLKYK